MVAPNYAGRRSEFVKLIRLERKAAAAVSSPATNKRLPEMRPCCRYLKGDSLWLILTHQSTECLVRLGRKGRSVVHAEDVKRELE
jgi:hypothetical protein